MKRSAQGHPYAAVERGDPGLSHPRLGSGFITPAEHEKPSNKNRQQLTTRLAHSSPQSDSRLTVSFRRKASPLYTQAWGLRRWSRGRTSWQFSQGKVYAFVPVRQAARHLRQVVEGALDRFQGGACDVSVDLRGSRASVFKQLLDQPEVPCLLRGAGPSVLAGKATRPLHRRPGRSGWPLRRSRPGGSPGPWPPFPLRTRIMPLEAAVPQRLTPPPSTPTFSLIARIILDKGRGGVGTWGISPPVIPLPCLLARWEI